MTNVQQVLAADLSVNSQCLSCHSGKVQVNILKTNRWPCDLGSMPNHNCLAHCRMDVISRIKLAKDDYRKPFFHVDWVYVLNDYFFRVQARYISMNHSQKIAPCLMDRHVAQPLNETAETNDSIVISNNWNRYKLHHVHPCLLVFNIGEIESHLLVNMQWSFELLQDYLQMSKTWETSSFDRVSVASSILLWTNSNIK